MNPQIRRLFFVFAFLFSALVATSTYWLWRAPELEARQGNPNEIVKQLTIKRGFIYASNGRTVLAGRRQRTLRDGRVWWLRRYPQDELTAQVIGYSTLERARTGVEERMNDFLTGSNANLSTIVDRTLDKLRGLTQEGNDVVTTLDVGAQRVAMEQLAGNCGAAVALDPQTGRVLVMASTPSYDPDLVDSNFRAIERIQGACEPAAPLLNRASAGLFIPGSTFKVVTAAAALDSGRFTPGSEFDDPGYCVEYGRRVFNYADQGTPSGYGRVTFAEALENSINSVFCNIGKALGPDPILDYAERFGFYDTPPIELPSDEVRRSGLYREGRLFRPDDPNQVDPGRLAFGQERLQVTPLQMALVAAGVANDGVVMEPQVVERIVAPDDTVISRLEPKEWKTAIKPGTAAELQSMMAAVVESGTATGAQISGVTVAGKTGTAETGREGQNDTWFIAFAPVENPRVAVAVALSNQDGTGGSTAAPVAKAIMEAILRRNT
ncbi:MAG: peptidoglycan D,D-transpeptidase FtsI family protein [Gaiellaceae bacterium]